MLAGVLAITTIPCLRAAFQRTNEDEEESFLRAVRAALPSSGFQLVRLGYGDIDGSRSGAPVHLYFPDYLFSPPGRDRAVRDVVEWERDPTHPDAYFYFGVRCYTPEQSFDDHPGWRAPEVAPMRRACQRILDTHAGETVLEREVPSRGDPVRTGYYGSAAGRPMRLAVIKLRPKAK